MRKILLSFLFVITIISIYGIEKPFEIEKEIKSSSNVEKIGIIPYLGYSKDVFIVDTLAYTTMGHYLAIFNIKDKENPTMIGFYNSPYSTIKVYVKDNYVYFTTYTLIHGVGSGDLVIIDVSNPSEPQKISNNGVGGTAFGLYIENDIAYIGYDNDEGGQGLTIMDISNPSSPNIIGLYTASYTAYGVNIRDSFAYLANGQGLSIIDISDPSSPVEAGYCDTPGNANGVFVLDSCAYVADGGSGLRIIDVRDPLSPIRVGNYIFYDYTYGEVLYAGGVYIVEVNDYKYAYVAISSHPYLSTHGLTIIDVSSPSSLIEVGYYDTP